MAEVEADAEQRRVVANSMHRIPDNMNIKEGCNLLILLYKAGILYDTGYNEDENMIDFDESFNFDDEDDINCRLLPKELGNLPLLKTIELHFCSRSASENIPDRLQLASVKKVVIGINGSKFDSSLSPIMKIFSNSLEELYFQNTTREQTNEILRALQEDELSFRQSITFIRMRNCKLNGDDLVILMFNIRERFINLREIDVSENDIKSLCGIENKIKQVLTESVISIGSTLCKLYLHENPILKTISNGSEDNSTQISAVLTLLNNFDGISNLGILNVNAYEYDPDVENLLRINHAGRKLIRNKEIASGIIAAATATATTAPVINPALWPLILERAYKKYKCATGLFDLTRQHLLIYTEVYRNRTGCDGGCE
ncbi:hypothetical protein FRACYDRAFT_259352 [Fragilariopsis cylindrus CCMP1102]|uniref:RNI-like protein n=1 Tax=Fragilariopsis cylindrus CCMP1102 TaxID=635003 RepID=A0A1E7FZR9_9STRA|nr:hypothetical protein FRACYDRAFT_259352 [Fragilariopsis cylindrus CCMP1102]|eukprot:OEU23313.1 hypothetical protein FRACYDRAFT_259352 [Fragilariopsis cylindrus CCMP1102]